MSNSNETIINEAGKEVRDLNWYNYFVYRDGAVLAGVLKLEKNSDLLAVIAGSKNIREAEEKFTDEQRARYREIENNVDTSGHSGASWGFVRACASCILCQGSRNGAYMNWILDIEHIAPGTCELSAAERVELDRRMSLAEFINEPEHKDAPHKDDTKLPSFEELIAEADRKGLLVRIPADLDTRTN